MTEQYIETLIQELHDLLLQQAPVSHRLRGQECPPFSHLRSPWSEEEREHIEHCEYCKSTSNLLSRDPGVTISDGVGHPEIRWSKGLKVSEKIEGLIGSALAPALDTPKLISLGRVFLERAGSPLRAFASRGTRLPMCARKGALRLVHGFAEFGCYPLRVLSWIIVISIAYPVAAIYYLSSRVFKSILYLLCSVIGSMILGCYEGVGCAGRVVNSVISRVLGWMLSFFRCPHNRVTFPMTRRRKGDLPRTYVVCLDCGCEFDYDWEQMRASPELQAGNSDEASSDRDKGPSKAGWGLVWFNHTKY